MTTTPTWEKSSDIKDQLAAPQDRRKFLAAGVVLLAAVGYLIFTSTMGGAQYFMTVEALLQDDTYAGESIRISGAVIGDSIDYNSETLDLAFTIAHIPQETDDLALTLFQAVNDETLPRLRVHVDGQVKPDLLRDEAQAILTGKMGEDGEFYADELLLKCPSRFEEGGPPADVIAANTDTD